MFHHYIPPVCHPPPFPPLLPCLRQSLMVVDKDRQGHVKTKSLMGVRYVPLTHPSEMDDGFVWVPP